MFDIILCLNFELIRLFNNNSLLKFKNYISYEDKNMWLNLYLIKQFHVIKNIKNIIKWNG